MSWSNSHHTFCVWPTLVARKILLSQADNPGLTVAVRNGGILSSAAWVAWRHWRGMTGYCSSALPSSIELSQSYVPNLPTRQLKNDSKYLVVNLKQKYTISRKSWYPFVAAVIFFLLWASFHDFWQTYVKFSTKTHIFKSAINVCATALRCKYLHYL